jgi:hypothetical protein
MAQTNRAMTDELAILRTAHAKGKKLGIHPMLTASQPIRSRAAHLASAIGIS